MSTSFPRVGRLGRGYRPEQVDRFFAKARLAYEKGGAGVGLQSRDVRTAAFDLVRGGYDAEVVDAALDRMEDAFGGRERDESVGRLGEDRVLDELTTRAATLAGRLDRPDGERFDRGEGRRRGYHPGDVDELCHRLAGYFDAGEAMSVDEVRRAVFRTRRGRRGYREAQVDAYLERVVEVMLAAG